MVHDILSCHCFGALRGVFRLWPQVLISELSRFLVGTFGSCPTRGGGLLLELASCQGRPPAERMLVAGVPEPAKGALGSPMPSFPVACRSFRGQLVLLPQKNGHCGFLGSKAPGPGGGASSGPSIGVAAGCPVSASWHTKVGSLVGFASLCAMGPGVWHWLAAWMCSSGLRLCSHPAELKVTCL